MESLCLIDAGGHHYHIEVEYLLREQYSAYNPQVHVHPSYHLILISQGSNTACFSKGRQVRLEQNTLLFINPLVPHSFHLQPGQKVEHTSIIWRFCDENGRYGVFPLQDLYGGGGDRDAAEDYRTQELSPLEVAEFLNKHTQAAAAFAADSDSFRTGMILHELWFMGFGLLLENSAPGTFAGLAGRISGIIDRNFTNPELNISSIASELRKHPNYLNAIFRKEKGITINRYLNAKRMELARSILENSVYNVSEVARMCGFSQHSYFSRQFRKYYRNSPSNFRKPATGEQSAPEVTVTGE